MSGLSTLARLIAKRDRIRLPIWLYAIIALPAVSVYSLKGLYPTAAERVRFGDSISANATFRALDGQVYDPTSIGGLVAWRSVSTACVIAALFSVLTVVRHTRAEEESGRTELVSAGVVGRYAPLTAALTVVAGVNIAAALVTGVVLTAFGTGAAGSFALALGVAGAGLVFAGVAAVAAQLTESSRSANSIGIAALAVAFALRAAGDAGSDPRHPTVLSWLSPIGWAQQIRPYAGERWWILALLVGLAAVLVGVAYALVSRRDVGAGLVAARLGRPSAAPGLRSAWALAWRQQRGALLGWSVAFIVLGVVTGAGANGVSSLLTSSPGMQSAIERLGGTGNLTNAYFVSILGIAGLFAAAYAIQATLRLRAEETAGRTEALLATPLTRLRHMAAHLVIALVGSAALLALAGVTAGLTWGAHQHDIGGQVRDLLGAALAQWPAVAVVAGAAAALFGLVPKATVAAWGLLGALVLLGQIGPLLKLSRYVMDISPFVHVPRLPGPGATATPLVVLVAVAVVLLGAGFAGFRRRDIG